MAKRSRKIAEISMLNLIDVIFILLIFFMLSTTFKQLWQYELELPAATSEQSAASQERCLVLIDASAQAWWMDGAIKRQLDENAFAHLKECANVELAADKSLAYERVVAVISQLASAQITSVKLNIERN